LSAQIRVKSRPSPSDTTLARQRRLEAVTRRYRPGSAALDELVEVLYRLLVDVPANGSTTPQPERKVAL
jgi:hypothetical protein